MKPDVAVRFNGGNPVITIASNGYLTAGEAFEHANEVFRAATQILGDKASLVSELRGTIDHLQPVVIAAIDWQEDPSTAADTALHKALNAYTDRCDVRARTKKATP